MQVPQTADVLLDVRCEHPPGPVHPAVSFKPGIGYASEERSLVSSEPAGAPVHELFQ
jgi:hypothetical protein